MFLLNRRKRRRILMIALALIALPILLCFASVFGMTSATVSGVSYVPVLGTPLAGYTNAGSPPSGGSCNNINQYFPDNPFQGWPLDFYPCDWSIISAYFCSPNYTREMNGFTHWGMDFAKKILPNGKANLIEGAPVLATAFSRVVQAVSSDPPGYNYGMGNFVQLQALAPICETAVGIDLDGDRLLQSCLHVCESEVQADLNGNGQIDDYCGEPLLWKATYMHLMDATVSQGQIVRKGQVIGHVDNTGNSTGSHLHYQINGPHGAIDPGPTLGCDNYDWNQGIQEGR